MGNNMMPVSRNASKSETAEYVAAALEMESALMTLGDAIESCKEKKEEYKRAHERDLEDAETELRKNEAELKKARSSRDFNEKWLREVEEKHTLKYWDWELFGGFLFIFLPLGFGISSLLAEYLDLLERLGLFLDNFNIGEYTYWIYIFLTFSIIITLDIIVTVCDGKRKKENAIYERAKERDEVESDLRSCQQNNEWFRTNLNNVKERIKRENEVLIPALDAQYASLCNDRKKISQTISEFYNIGIIPPDYRTMDCVIILNQIFRNDLADTMRDAIKIYEERVFRGEVIRGMDNICRNIGRLAAGMAVVESRINEIQSNVQLMSQDWNSFSDRIIYGQARQQKALAEMVQETRMSRYSAEKVAESVKNLEYYERRNQGWV